MQSIRTIVCLQARIGVWSAGAPEGSWASVAGEKRGVTVPKGYHKPAFQRFIRVLATKNTPIATIGSDSHCPMLIT